MKPKNLTKHELIGLTCTVVESTDPGLIGVEGLVVGETRNMLHIETVSKVKKVPKENCVFVFKIDGRAKVSGEKLLARPEDRVKRG